LQKATAAGLSEFSSISSHFISSSFPSCTIWRMRAAFLMSK